MEIKTLCVIGNARVQSDNPITHQFSSFFITFIVDSEDGEILDADVSMTLALSRNFVREMFLGKSLANVDEALLEEIRLRYLGSSQKALQVAYKDGVKKYRAWRNGVILAE